MTTSGHVTMEHTLVKCSHNKPGLNAELQQEQLSTRQSVRLFLVSGGHDYTDNSAGIASGSRRDSTDCHNSC